MRDDTRADVLFSALTGERELPGEEEYDELRVLAALGARLEVLGPAMAAMAHAENTFDPSFAAGLHRTLLAAHPATVQPESVQADNAARKAARTARRLSRRMLTLVVVALALAAVVVATILHDARQTVPVGTGVSRPTATPVALSARSFTAKAPSPKASGQAPAAGTPVARTFSPMELRPSPGARSTASRASRGAGTTQTAVGTAHGVTASSAPNRTPTPGLPRIATAPGPATPTVIHGASRRSGGPLVGAPGVQSAGGGIFRYRLPERMPSLPSTVPVYRLRPTLISPAKIRAIMATFSGLRPLRRANGLEFTNADEQLGITPPNGEITYTRLLRADASAPAPALSTSRALAATRDWLHVHHLFPVNPEPLAMTATITGVGATVRVVPSLHPAILPTAQIPAITVVVDSQGMVTSAQIRWATVESAGITALISPVAAARVNEKARMTTAASGARNGQPGTQASPLFTVTSITLAYQPANTGKVLALRPVYLFRGTLEGQPFSQTVAAVAR